MWGLEVMGKYKTIQISFYNTEEIYECFQFDIDN
jgi:hypothetical protein